MIRVIHGEDIVKSRKKLEEIKNEFKNGEILVFDEKINLDSFIQAIRSPSIFFQNRLIILENFFSKKKMEEQKDLLSFLKKISKEVNLVIWEEEELSKDILANLGKIEISLFRPEPILFKLLDSLRPNNQNQILSLFKKALKKETPEIIFYMIVRQFRMLLFIKNGLIEYSKELSRLALWQREKLVRQAGYFTPDSLNSLYSKLLKIDYDQKSGNTLFPLDKALELFLINL